MKMVSCQHIVTFALLVHDLSWITLRPEFGIPAMLVGLSIQIYLTVSSLRAHASDLYCQASLLFWLLGNVIWTLAEFIWDSGHPVGFLGNIKFVTELSPKWYPIFMYSALTIQTATGALLIGFYLTRWSRWRRQRGGITPVANPSEPLVGISGQGPILTGLAGRIPPAEAYVLLPWLPLRMYYELFTLPWILMDTFWAYFDLMDIMKERCGYICLALSAFFGVLAIGIQTDCVRRLIVSRQRSEAALSLAECFWVTGNVIWMLEDSLTHWQWMYITAIVLFATGPCLIIASIFSTDEDLEKVTASFIDCERVSIVNHTPAIINQAQRARAVQEALPACLKAQYITCAVPDAIKKKHHSARSRKASRLMKRVTILPRSSSDQSPNFAQLVARLALNALSEPGKAINLINLGHVSQRLVEWRKCLPNVLPHFAVHSFADRKVVELLHQGRCSFACATAEEVSLVLSLGASPEDVLFCEVRKLKAHLSYVKEKGVRTMPFDDAAELRKIAAEFPTAQLLLQLAPHKDEAGHTLAAQFGAARAEWPSLLALAAELGLEVVGVSCRKGPGGKVCGSLAHALKDARDVFKLASECGFSMRVLDLGGVDAPNDVAFGDVAATIQGQLTFWFPAVTFPKLRVIASPGQLFTRNASMLLTQVIAKEPALKDKDSGVSAAQEGNSGSAEFQYVLNAGLYGAFASILADPTEPEQPKVLALYAEDRPVRSCSFHGPSRDALDVILKKTSMPELHAGEWILWPRIFPQPSKTRSSSSDDADHDKHQSQVWYYAVDGCLPQES